MDDKPALTMTSSAPTPASDMLVLVLLPEILHQLRGYKHEIESRSYDPTEDWARNQLLTSTLETIVDRTSQSAHTETIW